MTIMRPLPKFFIDQMKLEYLDQIMTIEQVCFPTAWPRQVFEMELKSPRSFTRVSKLGDMVVGYVVAWTVYDEGHILNIAVLPEFRRMGIGEDLMTDCLDYFSRSHAKYALLEVRTSNIGAIKLYEKLGFKSIGIRRGYYNDTGEDAIVMMLTIK
ncbi:MAG: ribosomal protein S18-alanine N-acetyltransferase [Deltaproteobacteria bacterium]|nr:ribosomal protein S18-alanine N-acetyltransferase [Deltaproteobacteria bacterium]